ncbi:MAG: hypothetical protein LBQ75_02395 [Zoogloeaceae bacterium]|jgi:hypothetical protein|nr:hypothetical protein [Zoogloeaceae bacterium]
MYRYDDSAFSAAAPLKEPKYKAPGALARFGMSARRWFNQFAAPAKNIDEGDTVLYGANMTTVASLLGYGKKGARNRQIIYQKWAYMESDPIVSAAVKLLVTSALGGHETSGDIVFIEKKADIIGKSRQLEQVVDQISARLLPIFNKIAYPVAYTGAAFGDAYARIYYGRDGVTDLYIDELVRPQLVQPFEQGGSTIGYAIFTGPRNFERLDATRMARMKMPRVQWVPQFGVTEKSFRLHLAQDEEHLLPIMPSMAGGSLLYPAEEPYDNLYSSMLGLVGQRWVDSIDEQLLTVNMESMTAEQQQKFTANMISMLNRSKARAEDAVKNGTPVFERVRHFLPIWNEKQVASLTPFNQSARSNNITTEDVVFHARLLAGALGVDLSMIGFSDQLSGGLGEGGFFRTSAQAAESARVIRCSLAEFFDSIIDRHTMSSLGVVFEPNKRPWKINFYGSISALEAEKQSTRANAMNAGMMLVQAMQQMKELGASEAVMREFLAKTMMLDEEQANLFATLVKAQPEMTGETEEY